ncbi:MAG TPA: thiamine pyrophosphate-binding protein [Methylophaga aminisulfidivorans]|uniref:thiamine pyrophosphate-binding protein n=1 Tax=Methylophaga TaxID=40222 RepID=UPI00176CFEE8|nr:MULTISPECIES: thiamine pyrophosphate-binding protein [Methylophaga]HIC47369.1 thiamine pyrophosphate-binding protein [Methylophaga sp.]HIM38719.1 thiamine pyrophosphate-binding protein [Methylophaga aminisulfidivorans]
MSQQRVADYIFARVAESGVKEVFLLPGGGAMHLVDALGQNPDITFIPTHHEQAAAIAAEAYSRVNETLGVALVTTGPGATNALTAVAGAWIESVPLLIISGQVKRADMKADSGVRQMGPQEVDIVSMVKPITKYAITVDEPENIGLYLDKALHEAMAGRKGPVWLDVPLDVQASLIEPEELARDESNTDTESDCSLELDEVIQLIQQAERPIILAGHGIRLSGAAEAFKQLYEKTGIPVLTTWNSLDLIPYEHPLCAGRPGSVALRPANFAAQNCDLLISIGARLDNVVTAHNPQNFAQYADKVIVDIDASELKKHQLPKARLIQGNAKTFIEQLNTELPELKTDYSDWINKIADWKQRYPRCDGEIFPEQGEISHYHFIDRLSALTKANELIITGSSGLAVEVFYSTFVNKPGQRIFLTSGLGSMGYGLPAAIGGCLASGRKPVVSVEGDGSLQLNLQELSTLKSLNLPIRMFVMNNNGYASIRNTQRNYFDERYVATGQEAGLLIPDLVKLAEAIDLDAVRISDASELDEKIHYVLNHPGPILCDVTIIKDEALWPKVSAIPQANGSMVSMPLEDMSPLLSMEQLHKEMLVPVSPNSTLVERR